MDHDLCVHVPQPVWNAVTDLAQIVARGNASPERVQAAVDTYLAAEEAAALIAR
jgi:hypothetical protein